MSESPTKSTFLSLKSSRYLAASNSGRVHSRGFHVQELIASEASPQTVKVSSAESIKVLEANIPKGNVVVH